MSGWSISAEPEQELVQQPLRLQDADPGVDADQERRPERQDDQHHEDRPDRRPRPRHAVGDRIADEERDQGRDEGDPDARQIGLPVERIREEVGVVVERRARRIFSRDLRDRVEHRLVGRLPEHRRRQRDLEDDQERREEEDQQPDVRNPGDDAALPGKALGVGHRASPTSSARRRRRGAQESQTLSSQVIGRSTLRCAFIMRRAHLFVRRRAARCRASCRRNRRCPSTSPATALTPVPGRRVMARSAPSPAGPRTMPSGPLRRRRLVGLGSSRPSRAESSMRSAVGRRRRSPRTCSPSR